MRVKTGSSVVSPTSIVRRSNPTCLAAVLTYARQDSAAVAFGNPRSSRRSAAGGGFAEFVRAPRLEPQVRLYVNR